jgi:sugar/nucleoside kinase (ribokinase family)
MFSMSILSKKSSCLRAFVATFMTSTKVYDVVLIGQMMKDRIVLRNETIMATGGAVYYAGLVVQRLGLQAAVVTKLAKTDDSMLDEFREVGLDVFPSYAPVTSSVEIAYPTEQPDKRTTRFLSVSELFTRMDIPDRQAKIIHVCPLLRGEISLDILRMLGQQKEILALDAQGFIRGVAENGAAIMSDWEEKAEGLQYVDILKVDDVEAEILTGKPDIRKAAKKLTSYGPKEVVVTYKDGVVVYVDGEIYEAAFTSKNFKGRTGRGDTTMGAYLSRRLTHSPQEACQFAAALVSLKMEEHGPFCKGLQDVEMLLEKHDVEKI